MVDEPAEITQPGKEGRKGKEARERAQGKGTLKGYFTDLHLALYK